MRLYKLTSYYYDNGKTAAHIEIMETDEVQEPTYESTEYYDRYVDYYATKTAAMKQLDNVLNA